ncbi:MAG: PAS domain-containing sensor histidine kinase [Rhodothermales bacterium]
MKKSQVLSRTRRTLSRDVVFMAGLAVLAFVVGRFTPVFDQAFSWTRHSAVGLPETIIGMVVVVAVVAPFLWISRRRTRSAAHAGIPQGLSPGEDPRSDTSLVLFPLLAPHPILEITAEGEVLYANPAAVARFPDIKTAGSEHPILRAVPGAVDLLREGTKPHVVQDIHVGTAVYELYVSQIPDTNHLGLYLFDITTRRRVQEALYKSEEKFSRVFRSAPTAMSVSRLSDGRFIHVNDSFMQLLGYEDRSAVIGKTGMELGMWVYPGVRAHLLGKLAQSVNVVHRHEVQVYHTSGEVRDVLVSVVVLEVGGEACILSTLLDMTERREAEIGLEVLKAFYENTLKELPIEVTVLDAQARFFYLNPEAVPDEDMRLWMVGKTSVDFALAQGLNPTPYQRRHEWLLQVIEHKEIGQLEETLYTSEGVERHMLRVATPVLDEDGEVIYVVGYGMDITNRKAFEQKLLEAKNAAEEMARLKSAFVANMSHEVRTPLTAILGFAKVLEEELEDEQQELADLIKQSGERLLETLNSVLDLARLEANAIEVDPELLNLGEEVAEAARLFQPMAVKKGLAFTLEMPDHQLHAQLDRPFLHRILNNLLSNAIKFTEEGEIRLTLRLLGDHVQIQVQDTGIGIGDAFLPHLFEEFKQESTGLARTHTGSGLGLAITRHLVERLNGRIEVESTQGVGTIFSVTFPAMWASLPSTPPAPPLQDQLGLFVDQATVNT